MKTIKKILVAILLIFYSCEKPEITNTDLQSVDFKSTSKSGQKSLKINLITKEAPFAKREGHTSITFGDKIWIIGGYEGIGGNAKSDIWSSKDGSLWNQSLATKHFSPRTSHTTTVFKDNIWVIGGNEIPNRKNDVWQSKDGMFWKEVTPNANFSERSSHTTVSFDNKLWVIGGLDQDKKPMNDVWYSKDGANWIQATPDAGFSPRFDHTALVYDNRIWVIGGKDGIGFSNKVNVKNDVWYSSNGVDWKKTTTNAAFLPRSGHTSVIYNDKMWVLGGANKDSEKIPDAWCSKDGKSWKPALKHELLKRAAHTTTVFDKKMWSIAGIETQTKNDVFTLED